MENFWTIHEQAAKKSWVSNKLWTGHEKVMKKSWTNGRQSYEQVMIEEQVKKLCKRHEKLMEQSGQKNWK